MDVRLPDGTLVQGVPEGTTKEQLLGKLQLARHPAAELLMHQMSGEQATADTSGIGKFLAGAGKAVNDIGLGARQIGAGVADFISPRERTLSGLITGQQPSRSEEIQREVDETQQRDAPLMNSGAGMAGNIAGNVGIAVLPGLGAAGLGKTLGMPALQAAGTYMLASPATLGGALTQGTMGAIQSGLQPVGTGGSRMGNTAIGFGAGAAIPLAGMAVKGAKAVVEPMYESGREAIMGRTLRRVAGDQADEVARALSGAREIVPGSMPTAGQAANNPGIAALERAAFATEPSVTNAVENRLLDQNAARIAAIKNLVPQSTEVLEQAREAAAGPLYRQAMKQGVDPEMAKVLQPQIQNLMERMPSGVLDKAKELARVNGEAFDKAGSVQGLHWVKQAVDDMISGARETGIGQQTKRALVQFKGDLLTVLDDLSPVYKQGREAYAAASVPINQSAIAEELLSKGASLQKGTQTLTPAAYARALSDTTAQRATGFGGATLANTMDSGQMATLNAIKDDLARAQFAQTAGRGVGSDTVQKMAYHNLMQQSGMTNLPNLLSRPVQLAEYGGRAIYGSANKEMQQKLAQALLDPRLTAELMKRGIPSARAQMFAEALRSGGGPMMLGTTPALLDARQ